MSIMIVSEHRTLNNPQHSLPSVRLKCHYVTTPGGSSAMYKLCHPLSSLSVISPRFLTNISQIKVSSAAPPPGRPARDAAGNLQNPTAGAVFS